MVAPVDLQNVHMAPFENVHVMIWKGKVDADALDASVDFGMALARRFSEGFWSLSVAHEGLDLHDTATRRRAAEVTDLMRPHVRGSATVIPGVGFWPSAARSAITAIRAFSKTRANDSVHADIPAACTWLAAQGQMPPSWAVRLEDHVREMASR